MINFTNTNPSKITINGVEVLSVYIMNVLIWTNKTSDTIESCYATGEWLDEYPWTDETTWADTK
jgi:hypothetical protein